MQLNELKALIANVTGVDPEEIKESSFFEDDLNIGELEMVELLSEIEETYEIEIDNEEREGLETVQDLYELLLEKVE